MGSTSSSSAAFRRRPSARPRACARRSSGSRPGAARRLRALDAVPDGRSDTVAATTSLPEFPAYEHSTGEVVDLVTARVYAAVDTIRSVHDTVDAEDPSTADILHQLIDGLEKQAWLLKSENRKV